MFADLDLIDRLAKVRHFRTLRLSAIREIVTSGQVQTFSAGEIIYNEGWPCAGLFVLLRGRVHLRKN